MLVLLKTLKTSIVFAPKIFWIFLSRLCETLLTNTASYIVHENSLDFRFYHPEVTTPREISIPQNLLPLDKLPHHRRSFYPSEVTAPGEISIQAEGTSSGEVTIPRRSYYPPRRSYCPPEEVTIPPGEVSIPSGEATIPQGEVTILPEVTISKEKYLSSQKLPYPRRSIYPPGS